MPADISRAEHLTQAYRTEAEVGGGRVTIEGLPFSEGERVKVIVLQLAVPSAEASERYPRRGLPIEYPALFDSAAGDDWDALC